MNTGHFYYIKDQYFIDFPDPHLMKNKEIKWARYAIGENIQGLSMTMIEDYLKYLGNLRCRGLGFENIYPGYEKEPTSMSWVSEYSDPNAIKTDFFEAKVSAYAKSTVIEDDL